jgi:NAD dependent epimerase/dehydratase
MTNRILVTGADGFIGSHLVEELVRKGHSVRAFVLYNSFGSWGWLDKVSPEVKGKFEVFMGDIRDPFGTEKAVKGCNIVYHLAALIAIPYSYHSPSTYVDTNIHGTLNILQAANNLSVERLIHTSTSEVYGSAQYVPIDENHPLVGQSPYSATKIAADQLALSFYRSYQTPVTVIRPFNTYGPRQSARAVIPTIILQILEGRTEINLGSAKPTRDFSYVQDTVLGFIAALNSLNAIGKIVNLGSGFEISIADTVTLIAKIMGANVDISQDSSRLRPDTSEVDRLYSNNKLAMQLMGWQPVYQGLVGFEKGLEKTIEWFSEDGNSADYKKNIYNV